MKNAITYKAQLPNDYELSRHMMDRPWRDLQSFEKKRHAFVPDENTGRRVNRFPGGYSFCLRTDEKIIPSDVVKTELEKRVHEFEKENESPASNDERGEIRSEIMDEFMERALIKEKYTWGYYDETHQFLYVDTAAPAMADNFMNELVQCCASVKTETINIASLKKGLTTRLKRTIEAENDFGAFEVGESLRLVRKRLDEPTERVVYTESNILAREVLEQVRYGFEVEHIALGMAGMWFNLTHKFHFRRIDWPEMAEAEDGTLIYSVEDEAERQALIIGTRVAVARGAVLELCRLMDYEQPKLEEEEGEL